MVANDSPLLQPFRLGDLTLPNRVVMAPLTRNRATHGSDVPSELAATYYRQRASAGLIVSEGTQISQQGQGYVWTPGMYTDAQVEGWRRATDAVHEAGGRIFAQLWHVGRISHVSLQPNGGAPVAPSAIRANTRTFIESGFAEVSEPRALETAEISGVVADFATAAANAKRAGFDGVELHGANGYLIDQFLRDGTNKRTDAYGGSVENRARFALEVVDAVVKVWPAVARRHPHRAGQPGQRHRRFQSGGDLRPSRRQAVGAEDRLHPRRRGRDPGRPQHRAVRLARRCAAPSPAPISPTTATRAKWPTRRSPPAMSISSPSAGRSSPIPIWSSACAAAPSWRPATAPRSTAAARTATRIIRRSARRDAPAFALGACRSSLLRAEEGSARIEGVGALIRRTRIVYGQE